MKSKHFFLLMLNVLFSISQVWADANGTLGDNISWKYDEATKNLTISGTGEMQTRGAP